MQICILDDDRNFTEFVARTLREAGHSCHVFSNAKDLFQELRRNTFDLLLLDWVMPVTSGDRVLEKIRSGLELDLPVIFLTVRNAEADVIAMLKAGADDYIVKPVSPALLIARVDTLLRRVYRLEEVNSRLVFGIYEFHPDQREVSVRGTRVTLAQKEFDLALLLFRNTSRTLSRAYIRSAIWKNDVDIHSRTIETHISGIRSKLTLRPNNGYRIASVYGYGYRLEDVTAAVS